MQKLKKNKLLVFILLGLFVFIAILGFFLIQSTSQNSTNKKHGATNWITYANNDLPFVFDYPSEWRLEEQTEKNKTSIKAIEESSKEHVLTVVFLEPTFSLGVAQCQIKRETSSDVCSYIPNKLVKYFYHIKGDSRWTGDLGGNRIYIELIRQNQTDRENLIMLAKTIREI